MAYPPPPWKVDIPGVMIAAIQLVDIERVRPIVPAGFDIVAVLPGKTVGGLFAARYGPGSTVEYNEFGAFPAFVRYRGKSGVWVARMYVDNEDSLEMAREVLGLPKEMAEFVCVEGSTSEILLRQGSNVICSIRHPRPLFIPWRQRISGGAFGVLNSEVIHFGGEFQFEPGLARAKVEIPPESPIAHLGLDRPLIAVCGRNASATLAKDVTSLGMLT